MTLHLASPSTGAELAQVGDHDRKWFQPVAMAVVASFVAFYAFYVFHHSDFKSDDLHNLLLMRQISLRQFLLIPIDVHFVPMHRLMTAVAYWLSPMNFLLAVAISAALHLAAIYYLYRLLRLLKVGAASWLVVCCYAASIVPLFGMIWWAHAEHRFPYVFCGVYAAFHYVSWLRQGGRWHFLACLLAFVVGIGFYEKAVLFPAQMAAFAFFADPRKFLQDWRRSLLIPFMLGLLSLAYVGVYLSLQPSNGHVDIALAARAVVEFIKMLGTAIAGMPVFELNVFKTIGWSRQTVLTAMFWLALMIFTIARSRRCVWLWLGLLGLVCLDYLPIAVSIRIQQFAFGLPHSYRFGFEELYVIAVFLGLVLKESFPIGVQQAWREQVACTFVVIYAIGNVFSLYACATRSPELQAQATAHTYMRHLRHDMARLHDPSPGFEQSPAPAYMSGFRPVDAGAVAQLLNTGAIIGLPAQTANYRVDDSGHVLHVSEPAHGDIH